MYPHSSYINYFVGPDIINLSLWVFEILLLHPPEDNDECNSHLYTKLNECYYINLYQYFDIVQHASAFILSVITGMQYVSVSDGLELLLPMSGSHLLIQCIAGMLSGFTTTIITNPMDTIRARLQVSVQSF